jgi:hypothetical protein
MLYVDEINNRRLKINFLFRMVIEKKMIYLLNNLFRLIQNKNV